ncbi:MAG: TonB-dependent receptor [Bacteroidales bacterium]|nr:TonB-dependent receptor [Bacteroidales bacterium]MDZ4204753.1 TonB-dependent receptor [Bacteroidales bacterium]
MKKLVLLTLLIGVSLAASPQSTLSGYVTDFDSGEALSGAHIVFENTLLRALTDNLGYFQINNLRTGNYRLKVSFIGYESHQELLTLEASKIIYIRLLRKPILSDEVVISATRAGDHTPVSHSTMTNMEIRQLNMGRDIPMLLESLPSVVSTSDAGTGVGYTSLRIRGTDMNRINITVNGIPLNDSESHGVWWVNMPDFVSSVDNIQVQRGVGTSTNGAAAFGASINMQTHRLNADPYAELSTGYGSFNTWRNSISFGSGILNNNFTFDGRLSKITSDGYIDRAWANLQSYYITAAYHSRKTIVRAKLFSGDQHTYQAWDGVPSNMLSTYRTYNGIGEYSLPNGEKAYYENETDNYKQDHYQLFLTHEPNRHLNLFMGLHYTRGLGYYEQYKENRKFADYGLPNVLLPGNFLVYAGDTLFFPGGLIKRTNLVRRKFLDNNFYGMVWSSNYKLQGLQLTLGGSLNQYIGDHYGTVIWAKYLAATNINHRWYDNTGQKTDFNIYAKAIWHFERGWRLFGDVQYRTINFIINGIDDDLRDITQQHTFSFLNPKFGLMWEPNSSNKMFASYANSGREPNRSNFTDAHPEQPLPTQETLHDIEVGYKYNSSVFGLSVNIFYMYYVDQLVLTGKINDVGAAVMTNVPESHRRGIEIETALKPTTWLQWNANLSLSRNIITRFTEYVDDWDKGTQIENEIGKTQLSFSPNVVAGSQLTYMPLKGLSITLHSKYVGKQYIDNTASEERKLDPYFVNNLRFIYQINLPLVRNAEVMLHIINLLNSEYETNAWIYRYISGEKHEAIDGYFPQAGIHYMVGINVRL